MDTSKLRDDTRQLWHQLEHQPALTGFVLIGGTALTMHIGHRISEDLDFAYVSTSLPQRRIATLVEMLRSNGTPVSPIINPAAEAEFEDSGLHLAEFQQDYIAGGVKISFSTFDSSCRDVLSSSTNATPLRVATLDEVFCLKSLVVSQRSKTRDWFDLYVLMNNHEYTIQDAYNAYQTTGLLSKWDLADMRLRKCQPGIDDEGYEQLLQDPPSIDRMREFFTSQLDQLQVDLARQALQGPKS